MLQLETPTIERLADPMAWRRAAADLLDDLGFSLINSDAPASIAGSHLLVALRAWPTLGHFDPESVTVWVADDPRAHQVALTRAGLGRVPVAAWPRRALWGHVHIVDRLGEENRFLTFGGDLRIASTDDSLTVLDLASPAPIVRWGGHSQATDALTGEVGAFFGRLVVPANDSPAIDGRLAAEDPLAIYGAFLAWADARLDRIAAASGARGALSSWIDREEHRLRSTDRTVLARGARILADLGLSRPD
jgi:hypothetical protein